MNLNEGTKFDVCQAKSSKDINYKKSDLHID